MVWEGVTLKPYYRRLAEEEYARAYSRGRRLLRYSDEPSPWVKEFAASRYFPRKGRVADFGCGEGINGLYLANLGCRVVGFDVAPAAVAKARELTEAAGESVGWLVGDMVNCPLGSGSVDAVLAMACFGRLLHDTERAGFFGEVARVLKPGGYLLFNNGILFEEMRRTFPDVFDGVKRKRADEFDAWLKEEDAGSYAVPSQRYDTRKGYEDHLERVGLRIVHMHLDVSEHAWGIVIWARKVDAVD